MAASEIRQPATWIPPPGRLTTALCLALSAILLAGGGEHGVVALLDLPTAATTHWSLNAIGLPAALDGTTLHHPTGFGIQIGYRCTVLIPALVLAAFLIALPMPAGKAIAGVALGTLLLAVLNSLRLIGLYYLGVYSPWQFAFAHEWIGEGLMAVATIAFLFFWSRPPRAPQSHV